MSSIYTNAGDTHSDHIHRLICIYEPPYRYRCVTCNAHLQRKSGVMVTEAKKLIVKEDKKCK